MLEAECKGGAMSRQWKSGSDTELLNDRYDEILADVAALLEDARHAAARSVNAVMTMTYWQIGQRIFEHEQGGQDRGGWTVRQLHRQIGTQFYERTALSRDKAAMLKKGEEARLGDEVTPEEAIKDPYLLEFLDLRDEYSESDLEEALVRRLEEFLLELGPEFTFVGRQRRLRVGDAWYRVDLVFFHRRLRCLVIIDLKLGELNHADAGQMHLYCNYAREHWTLDGENPPVGLILCAQKDAAVAHYALEGLQNKVLAAEYRTALPDEKALAAEIQRTRQILDRRRRTPTGGSTRKGRLEAGKCDDE